MQSMDWNGLIKQAESAGGGDPIPPADYPVTVASCEAKTTSTGKPMLKVKAKVIGGPYDGRVLWNNITLSVENDNAVAIFMRHMAAFGLDKTYFAQQPSFEQVAQALLNRQALWSVKMGEYKGQKKNEVDDIKPFLGASVVPPTAAPVAPPSAVPPAPAPVPPQPAVIPQPAPVPTAPAPAPVPPPAAPTPAPVPAPPTPAPAVPQPVPTAVEPDPVSSTPAPPAPPF